MLRNFLRFLGPKQLALFTAFSLVKLTPYWANGEPNSDINARLKRKLNEKFQHRMDVSFELDEENR